MTKIEVSLPYPKDRTENLILKKASMKDSQLSNNVVQSAYCFDAIGLSFEDVDARAVDSWNPLLLAPETYQDHRSGNLITKALSFGDSGLP